MANVVTNDHRRSDSSGRGGGGSAGIISYDTVEENINVYLGNYFG